MRPEQEILIDLLLGHASEVAAGCHDKASGNLNIKKHRLSDIQTVPEGLALTCKL